MEFIIALGTFIVISIIILKIAVKLRLVEESNQKSSLRPSSTLADPSDVDSSSD